MNIKSLESAGFETIASAFNEAFCKYEVQISKQELSLMLKRRGFVPELSFGAFDDERLVSFTLNGIGFYNGVLTAYYTGTGTLEEYRGKGLASEVFNYSLPFLKKAGVTRYLLEVLQHNSQAVSVYKKQGFSILREFGYYRIKQSDIKLKALLKSPRLTFTEISFESLSTCTSFPDYNHHGRTAWSQFPEVLRILKLLGTIRRQPGWILCYGTRFRRYHTVCSR